MKYRPDIDGLRALAVVSVVAYHLNAALLPGGFVGVDVFFVISGFVVSASLAESPHRTLGGFITEFYARRLARIVPALLLMLTVAAIAATLFIPHAWLSGLSRKTALAAYLGLSNVILQGNTDTYFAPRAEFNPYTHTWSLGIEEQFYVICPLLLFLWVRARAGTTPWRARWPVAALGCLGAASLAGCIWATRATPNAAFYSIIYRFWELAAGVILFQLSVPRQGVVPRQSRPTAAFEPWIGGGLVAAAMMLATPRDFPSPWAVIVTVGTLLLVGGVTAPRDHTLRQLLARPASVWIGKRSYSLYLWHWPVLVLMRWTIGLETLGAGAVALGLTLLISVASYRYVERPLRHNPVAGRLPPVAWIVIYLLLILVVRRGVQAMFGHAAAISLSTVTRNEVDWFPEDRMPFPDTQHRPCQVDITQGGFAGGNEIRYRPAACTERTSPRGLFVIGDSHATMYQPMLDQLSAETGTNVDIYAFTDCAFVKLLTPMADDRPSGCLAFSKAVSAKVLATAQPGDILFLPGLRQWRLGDQWGDLDEPEFDSPTLGAGARAPMARAASEARDWLQPFITRGLVVLFEAPTPIFRSPSFRCSDWFNRGNPVCRGGLTQPRSYLEHLRAPVIAVMEQLTAALPAVHIWDPFRLLCPADTCAAISNGRPLFFDGDHLSGYGNTVVYPSFRTTMARLRMGG